MENNPGVSGSDASIGEVILGIGVFIIGAFIVAAAASSGGTNRTEASPREEPRPVTRSDPPPRQAMHAVTSADTVDEDTTEYSGTCNSCGRACGGACGTGDFYYG